MSDTTNVMKGARSGVQKLIKRGKPHLHDAGCRCHLADLCVKAGMAALPVDIYQLFIDVYYYFKHSGKRNQQFGDIWYSFYNNESKVLLKHCQTRLLNLLRCIRRYLDPFDGVLVLSLL